MQQEAAPSSEIPISGAPACDRLHPIIFGRSQILPSRPLFTVAYLIKVDPGEMPTSKQNERTSKQNGRTSKQKERSGH